MFIHVVEAVSVPNHPVAAFLCCASKVGSFLSTLLTQPEVNNVLGFAVEGLKDSD